MAKKKINSLDPNDNFRKIFASILQKLSRPIKFLRKGVLKICSKFTGERSCQSVISIKLLCIFIEITLRHWCSLVNCRNIFRKSFYKNTSGGLLLALCIHFLQ